jgi:hypothetical protein
MANTLTLNAIEQGNKQFQGAFSEMFAVTATVADQDAVAIGDTAAFNITVPGAALGDFAIGALNMDTFDGDGDGAVIRFQVTSANTVSMTIHADVAEFAADAITGATVKILVMRPAW